jgi:hypothetical protein
LVDLHLEDLEEDGMLILISTVSSENRFWVREMSKDRVNNGNSGGWNSDAATGILDGWVFIRYDANWAD